MRYRVSCPACAGEYVVVGIKPGFCVDCGVFLPEKALEEQMELTRSWLARQPYEAPAEAPDLNEMTDAWQLRDLTGVGYTLCRRVVIATQEREMVFEKPTDLLALGGIGVTTAAKFVGKVRFGK